MTSSSGDKFNSSTKYVVNHLKDVDYKENALKLQKKVVITYIFEKELTDYLKMMKIQVNLLVNK